MWILYQFCSLHLYMQLFLLCYSFPSIFCQHTCSGARVEKGTLYFIILTYKLILGSIITFIMPKNTGRGGKNYRRGNNKTAVKRELVLKEEGTVYGQILKMLGNGRVEVYCFDSVKRTGNIRGKMKRRVWIAVGDVVLVSLRDFQNQKCDIILKYTPEQVRQLKAQDQIPESIEVNQNDPNLDIEFQNDKDNDDSSGSDDSSDESQEQDKPKLKQEDIDNI